MHVSLARHGVLATAQYLQRSRGLAVGVAKEGCAGCAASAPRSSDRRGVDVLRVASVPASHIYVRHLAEPGGRDGVPPTAGSGAGG
jgi:hypothetical protein